jgi:hypothetical protein
VWFVDLANLSAILAVFFIFQQFIDTFHCQGHRANFFQPVEGDLP